MTEKMGMSMWCKPRSPHGTGRPTAFIDALADNS